MGRPMRSVSFRLLLAAFVVAVGAFSIGSGRAASKDMDSGGPRFVVRCSHAGRLAGGGGLGDVTCVLKVTGLPAPLDEEVSVTLVSGDDVPDVPSGKSAGDTFVSSEAPPTGAGGPVLVSRRLPVTPPPPLPVAPEVPQEPPRSL